MFKVNHLQKNVELSDYTTFKIGGPAKYFFIAKKQGDFVEAIKWAVKNGEKFFILGCGSNVLFNDSGFDGLVVKRGNKKGGVAVKSGTASIVEATGYCKLRDLSAFCLSHSLTGLEWSAGIPGTLGGAIRGNAGAFGSKMADAVKIVKVLEILPVNKKGVHLCRLSNLSNKQCKFEYRGSVFKKCGSFVILSAELALGKGNKKDIKEQISYCLKKRGGKHPANYPNAGSIFKNVAIANLHEYDPVSADSSRSKPIALDESYDKAKHEFTRKRIEKFPKKFLERGIIPAWWFIEQSGLKGKRIGNAMVSEKHANFIINLGDAKSKDVSDLINVIKKEVKKKFKVDLEEELVVVDFIENIL